MYFRFEADFVEKNIRCIPMIVRFKLDACGIKLKLAEWSRLKPGEREHLATTECNTQEEISRYREALRHLIRSRTGKDATDIPVAEKPAWSITDVIPQTICEKLAEGQWSMSIQQWQQLEELQRFALVKLSYAGHENKNFPNALAEFGLVERLSGVSPESINN